MFQVADCNLGLFANARWCEHVGIGVFVVAVFEVTCLHPALFLQALEAVVGLAQADAHFFGQLALAEVGVVFYEGEEFVGDFFVHFSSCLEALIKSFSTSLRAQRGNLIGMESVAWRLPLHFAHRNQE